MAEHQYFSLGKSRNSPIWGFVGFVLFALLSFGFKNDLVFEPYIDIPGFLFFGFSLVLSICGLHCFVNRPEQVLSKTHIFIRNKIWPKECWRRKIKGYREKSYENEDAMGTTWTLKTSSGFISFDSNEYRGAESLGNFIKKNYEKIPNEEFKGYRFYSMLWVRVFFFCTTAMFLGLFINTQYPGSQKLEKIPISLDKPLYETSEGGNSADYIEIIAKEYPDIRFKISGSRYEAFDDSALSRIIEGDTIEISIAATDLHSKLLKDQEPSFKTKHFSWDKIDVYQLAYRKYTYINQNILKRKLESDKKWSWIFLLFGLLSLYLVFMKYDIS